MLLSSYRCYVNVISNLMHPIFFFLVFGIFKEVVLNMTCCMTLFAESIVNTHICVAGPVSGSRGEEDSGD